MKHLMGIFFSIVFRRFYLGSLSLLLLLFACTPTNSSTTNGNSSNEELDRALNFPIYLLHITQKSVDGGVPQPPDAIYLLQYAPPQNGRFELYDTTSRQTTTLFVDQYSGPHSTPRQFCQTLPADWSNSTWTDLKNATYWRCGQTGSNPMTGSSGTNNDNNNSGNGNTGQNNNFAAWLECGDVLELESCEVSKPCGVYVTGWESNSAVPVQVTFPSLNGINVAPGNSSAAASTMHNSGVGGVYSYYFSEMVQADCAAPAGQTILPIQVWQEGLHGPINLSLTVNNVTQTGGGSTFGICPSQAVATLGAGWSDGQDLLGMYNYTPDNSADLYFPLTVQVNDPRAIVTYIRLETIDAYGQLFPQGNYMAWDSWANSTPFLGVYATSTGNWLTQPQQWMNGGLPNGSATFTLVVSDPYGYLKQANVYVRAIVQFGQSTNCVISSAGN